MLYQVTHSTRYSYESPVSHSLNEVRLTPRACHAQKIRAAAIHVQPEPAFMHQRQDYYGNSVASFELFEKHERLEIAGESMVEVLPAEPVSQPPISWEDARRALESQTDWTCIEASEFIHNSP